MNIKATKELFYIFLLPFVLLLIFHITLENIQSEL
jgi:hypothetical protein